ncbi:MAG: radical SAM protein [Acutalibacteraceae bacterium]|nr:radical SAM protein [Acutalibacteraceae bacterium]
MKIGLIDVDGHNFPNLALMKISAYHKARGDSVEWSIPLCHYDIVYQSKVFDNTYSKDIDWIPNADKVIKGGTGYGLDNILPAEIEHTYPDYSLYPELTKDTAFGFLTRGCPRACKFCIVAGKEGRKSVKVADLSEFWRGQKNIVLLDPNILACKDRMELLDQLIESKAIVDFSQGLDIRLTNKEVAEKLSQIRVKRLHFAWDNPNQDLTPFFKRFTEAYSRKSSSGKVVYVLTNFDSTMEQNLYRIYTLRDLGYDPYVMVYDKPNAPKEIRHLQRWVNNRFIFRKCKRFEDYKGGK